MRLVHHTTSIRLNLPKPTYLEERSPRGEQSTRPATKPHDPQPPTSNPLCVATATAVLQAEVPLVHVPVETIMSKVSTLVCVLIQSGLGITSKEQPSFVCLPSFQLSRRTSATNHCPPYNLKQTTICTTRRNPLRSTIHLDITCRPDLPPPCNHTFKIAHLK